MPFCAYGIPNFFQLTVRSNEERAADDAEKGFAEEFFHAARAVCFDGFEFGVAEKIEVELLLDLEGGLGFHGVAARAEDDHTELIELRLCVTKLGRFRRSTGSVGFGIEKEDDAPASEVRERYLVTSIVV